jgi:hypothetical protein
MKLNPGLDSQQRACEIERSDRLLVQEAFMVFQHDHTRIL